MPFDNTTRNRLQRLVCACRKLLTEEFDAQLQERYGIFPNEGRIFPLEKVPYLDDEQTRIANLLRERIEHISTTERQSSGRTDEAIRRVLREQAFTVLNRFAALRMAEERGIMQETVGNGSRSKAFQIFETVAHSGLGPAYERYRVFINRVFDEIAVDLGVLFDRFSPYGLLFPREPALLRLFELLNDPEVKPAWREDETIGWLYQYFNDEAERKKMREESSAPRNSRELAVRNQFFTPRYIVEFLTDNTLGRIWYEMTKGQTRLKEQCRYLVRYPNEIFLQDGETAPDSTKFAAENLSQEELLKRPVHIPHRPLKDPRSIRMLDPACGSMHFGLYAFDLFEVIYDEAWEIANGSDNRLKPHEPFARFLAFVAQYSDKTTFLREVPQLIIEHNIHGMDIDPRCAQIAGLSLWLRAQRSWREQRLQPTDRPRIRRSNIVCAEPMPGEEAFLNDFIEAHLSGTPEKNLLAQLIRHVFEAMKLAGEAGSLLRIEEEIASAVAEAKQKWLAGPQLEQVRFFADEVVPPAQKELGLDVSGITDDRFWERAEERIYAALQAYAERADHGDGYQRRLFADDAAQGFAFIDICRKRYDVVLMNPPFGLPADPAFKYLKERYPDSYVELFATMLERATEMGTALVGAITSRAFMVASRLKNWRKNTVCGRLSLLADVGEGVMDSAFVECAAYILTADKSPDRLMLGLNFRGFGGITTFSAIDSIDEALGGKCAECYEVSNTIFESFPNNRIIYALDEALLSLFCIKQRFEPICGTARQGITTFDDLRFIRLRWEVPPYAIGRGRLWVHLAKGGAFSRYYGDLHLLMKWANDGSESKALNVSINGTDAQAKQASNYWWRPGLTYSIRSQRGFSARALPRDCLFTGQGPLVVSESKMTNVFLLGWLNCDLIRGLIEAQSNDGKFMSGLIKTLPWVQPPTHYSPLESETLEIVRRLLERASYDEVNSQFVGLFPVSSIKRTASSLRSEHQRLFDAVRSVDSKWSRVVHTIYGTTPESVSRLRKQNTFDLGHAQDEPEEEEEGDHEDANVERVFASQLLSYLLGIAFGRWDSRFATGEKRAPELPDPFAPLPVCPPGQLRNDQGLPLTKDDACGLQAVGQWDYTHDIPWAGFLVDDPGHPLDLETCIHRLLQVIWKDRWEDIEHEACEIMGVATLREYFRKPTGFFADHLKRYSKSRRQAPIYWPLSTRSGSYTLWLYYHRLNDQTLFFAVNEFVKPKIAQVEADLARFSAAEMARPGRRAIIQELNEFRSELIEFQNELLRIAQLPCQPNLNDGVIITASPLWKLFRLPKWSKDLKGCWDALSSGKYDWAHLAYSIWPERVRKVCETDRSVAIAHSLEHLCKTPVGKTGKKRKKVSPEEPPGEE